MTPEEEKGAWRVGGRRVQGEDGPNLLTSQQLGGVAPAAAGRHTSVHICQHQSGCLALDGSARFFSRSNNGAILPAGRGETAKRKLAQTWSYFHKRLHAISITL